MARYSATERIGVNAVEQIVLGELGWIFREQPIADMGIDAHIERVDGGQPTGKLIAVQIKTGASHFHDTGDALTYYGSATHIDYWSDHSLPVLLIAHLPESAETYWVLIDPSCIEQTRTKWKVAIPKANVFGRASVTRLAEIFEGSPAQQRLRKLYIDAPLMQHIEGGGKVSVELEDWINKSLGRTSVKVYIYDSDGNETLNQDWYTYYTGYGMKELAEALFPWAVAIIDADFYDENSELEETSEDAFQRAMDIDNGIEVPELDPKDVYPYAQSAGEVEHYRLQLTLGELGEAFLVTSAYLDGGSEEI